MQRLLDRTGGHNVRDDDRQVLVVRELHLLLLDVADEHVLRVAVFRDLVEERAVEAQFLDLLPQSERRRFAAADVEHLDLRKAEVLRAVIRLDGRAVERAHR